jgi:hypothetical protein
MCAPEQASGKLAGRNRSPIEILLSVLMKRKSNWDTVRVTKDFLPGSTKILCVDTKFIRDHKYLCKKLYRLQTTPPDPPPWACLPLILRNFSAYPPFY